MSGRYEHAKEVVGPGGHVGGQCGMCKQTVAQVDGKKSKGWVVTMCPRCDSYPPGKASLP
jgi:hypothetical protein